MAFHKLIPLNLHQIQTTQKKKGEKFFVHAWGSMILLDPNTFALFFLFTTG